MKKFGIGIIGCGTIMSVHLDSIHEYDGVELIMVCDIDSGLAKSVAQEERCLWVTDYKEVLTNENVDIVHILTPHYLHASMAIEALKMGKHVVLEKPVGINLKELEELKEIASETGLTVGVTLQNRFNPTTIKMKELIGSGKLGKLIASKGILTWCRKGEYYSDSTWRGKLATEGGGLLINQGIHTLDLMEYIGGPIKKIKGHIANYSHPDIEVEDTAMMTMEYENGAIGNFYGTNSYGDNSPIEMEFIFEKGQLQLRDRQLILVKNKKSELVIADILKEGNKSYWGMSHKLIIKDIYDSIKNKTNPKVSLEDGIRATQLVLLCYQ
ncbi:oxidoreductase [Vallitalea longa]|uniref:Oxidoreductase n=1 Tax=Vallitalea longa TaxID=2936439 RepID=A0A9W5YFN4_9FIRM|nr:Gfo/Idh/MocA family oxidoreductase [Vallitalea longa]GKX31448.1 oxidoreductase [Vallitalea longa]